MKTLYPIINKNLNLHYFGEYSLLTSKTEDRMIFDETQTDILELCTGYNNLEYIYNNLFDSYSIECEEEEKEATSVINDFLDNMVHCGIIQYENEINNSTLNITGERFKYYPNNLVIEIVDYCNLKCSHCFKSANNILKNTIQLDEIKKLATSLKNKVNKITITGGEPTIHPNINEILKLLEDDFEVCLMTNATNLHNLDPEIIEKLDSIQISIYGLNPQEYKKITQNEKAFDNFISGLNKLNELNKDFKLSLIMHQENKDNLEDFIKFAAKHKAKTLKFALPMPFGRANIDQQSREKWTLSDDDIDNIDATLVPLVEKYKNTIMFNTVKNSLVKDANVSDFFETNYKDCFSCGAGVILLSISADKKVKPCEVLPAEFFSMGNLEDIYKIVEGTCLNGFKKEILNFDNNCKKENIPSEKICRKIKILIDRCIEK